MKLKAVAIAKLVWNMLGLEPEETTGYNHYNRKEFEARVRKILDRPAKLRKK